jgi:hypothetical protein
MKNEEKKTVELEDLVGKHILSGVDREIKPVELSKDWFEDCEVISFVLDGKTYTAIEDPEDGYRSNMREITLSEIKVQNNFQGIKVMGKMRDSHEDIIEFYEISNGKLILAIGTGGFCDYPYWVAEFNPQNMSINEEG